MTLKTLKKGITVLAMGLFVLEAGTRMAHAINVPVGGVDLTKLAVSDPVLNSASLVKWRTGTASQDPVAAAATTFQYFVNGVAPLALPTRANPADNSANDQNDMWSDNAVQVNYVKGNNPNVRILMYTDNTGVGIGGLVNQSSTSVLQIMYKAQDNVTLEGFSDANVDGTKKLTSPMFMPTEITTLSGGACPNETATGGYPASTRTNNGFCDYFTKYMTDDTNATTWYTNFTGSARLNAFIYSSIIGPKGVNLSEDPSYAFGGKYNPANFVFGAAFADAIPDTYTTTIKVNKLTL